MEMLKRSLLVVAKPGSYRVLLFAFFHKLKLYFALFYFVRAQPTVIYEKAAGVGGGLDNRHLSEIPWWKNTDNTDFWVGPQGECPPPSDHEKRCREWS